MCSARSRGRIHPESEDPYRTVYQRDRDRIIHSTAFRRLEYKTQVFVNHEGDYYRTRLTHTIEVAQISRVIARCLVLNEDLTEAIALAHDLGHTPFGHSGEDALRQLMVGRGGFEHNMQGLRIVDKLERRYPGFEGLNLSYELRESIAKHKTIYDNPVPPEFCAAENPILEAQVVEIADSIAYDSHDLDDGLKAGILSERKLAETELWARASANVLEAFPGLSGSMKRHQTVRLLINMQVVDLLDESGRRLAEADLRAPEDVRKAANRMVGFTPQTQALKAELQAFLTEELYQHYRVARMAEKAKRFVARLFEEFVRNPRQMPLEYQKLAESEGVHRAACDYIAGMTDRFAQEEYLKLFCPYESM